VIKSTGDGLLLYFTSAVQAVEWALKTQRHFADQATSLPATELLQHRIGIHVGEIIIRGGDVMGDGVNVAARVQTEARAGGICISQVVYGVVKNKLKLDVIRLEARKLKNIAESVQMYHVLLEAPSIKTAAPMVPKVEMPAPKKPGLSARALILTTAAVLLVGGAVVFIVKAQRAHKQELQGSEMVKNALGEALRAEQNQPTVTVTQAPAPPSPGTTEPVAAPPQPAAPKIDFIKLTTLRPAGNTTPAEKEAMTMATAALQPLNAWLPGALSRWTKGRPLAVRPLSASQQQAWTVFTDSSHQLYFAEGGAYRKREWSDLKPDVQGAIIVSLFTNSSPLSRDVVRGAEAFAYLYGLPELAEKLVR
jgi:hypothetical protein